MPHPPITNVQSRLDRRVGSATSPPWGLPPPLLRLVGRTSSLPVHNLTDEYRRASFIRGIGILKGEKPADVPAIQSTKLELVINLETAKALGLDIPPTCSPAPTR